MNIIVKNNFDEVSETAAELFADVVKKRPQAVLGLATGSSVLGLYERIVGRVERGELSLGAVTTFNLDEYVGIGGDHPQSYAFFMRDNLFSRTDIDMSATNIPDGLAFDLDGECQRYTESLRAHPRDLQILGLGSNGHIAFNEPGCDFDGHTHVVRLAESTVKDNSRLFDRLSDVPRLAITMGIADILDAKRIVLLVGGANKANAVCGMVHGKVTNACPASILQTHKDVTVIADREAARLL